MVHGCLKDRMNDWMKKCRHTWATLTAVLNLMFPLGCTWCSLLSNRPTSDVKVTNTSTVLWKIKNCENLRNHKLQSLKKKKKIFWTTCIIMLIFIDNREFNELMVIYLPIAIKPTLFSGLERVLEWHTRLTASCCAWNRVGMKSPFLI